MQGNSKRNWNRAVFTFLILLITIGSISGYENGKSVRYSAYKTPTGDFLLPQPENENILRDHHGTPSHFEELRSIHKIKDRYKRETILQERIRRQTRSPQPQLLGTIGFGVARDEDKEIKLDASARSEKSAAINSPVGIAVGAKFDAPSSVAEKFETGFEIGGGGGELKVQVPQINIGADLELGTAGFNVEGDLPQVKANVGAGILTGKLKLEQDEILPYVSAKGAEVGLQLNAPVSIPTINVPVSGDAKVNVSLPVPNINVGLSSGVSSDLNLNKRSKGNLNIDVPALPVSVGGELGAALPLTTTKVEADVKKLGVDVTIPSINVSDLNLDEKSKGNLNFDVPPVGVSVSGELNAALPVSNIKVGLQSNAPVSIPTINVQASGDSKVNVSLPVPNINVGLSSGVSSDLNLNKSSKGNLNIDVPALPVSVGGELGAALPLTTIKVEADVNKLGIDVTVPSINFTNDLNLDKQSEGSLNIDVPASQISVDRELSAALPVTTIKVETDVEKLGVEVTIPSINVISDLNLDEKSKENLNFDVPPAGVSVSGELNAALPVSNLKVDTDVNRKLGVVNVTVPSFNTNGDLSLDKNVQGDLNFSDPASPFSLEAIGGKGNVPNLNVSLVSIEPDGTTTVEIPYVNLNFTNANEKLSEILQNTTTDLLKLPISTTEMVEEETNKKENKRNDKEDDENVENTTTEQEPEAVELATTTTQSSIDDSSTTQLTQTSNEKIEIKSGELLLPLNYEILEIPKPNYGKSVGLDVESPLVCFLFIRLLGISHIDEIQGSITIDVDFTVEWIDGLIFDVSEALGKPRPTEAQLLKEQYTLSPTFLKKIWRPDIYMDDLIRVDQPTISNKEVASLKFNKLSGFISYTVRNTVTVNCPMSFEYYPADTQRCAFRMASYSHTNDDMSLNWLVLDAKNIGVVLEDDSEHNFDINIKEIDKYDYTPKWNNPANSTYEVLTFTLAARRKISYHLIQTYLPSAFNIFITWLVFLIPYTLYDCRIGTTMTTLLTLTAMFSGVREQSPQVNYIKAIDLWMLACVLFIFLNLAELTVMTWMRTTIEAFEQTEQYMKDQEDGRSGKKNDELDGKKAPWKIQTFRKFYNDFSQYSFLMFAGVFLLFNIVYWTWLFVASEYFNWNSNKENKL